jgi:signal transduction histidine kinase
MSVVRMNRYLMHCAGGLILSIGVGSVWGGPPLRTVAEVRALSADQAASGRAVVLSGTVTYVRLTEVDFNFSLHDGTGGLMVYPAQRREVRPGQRVVIEGGTSISIHGIQVRQAKVEPGAEGPLPIPLGTTMAEVCEGRHEGEFAEMEGVLRAVRLETPEVRPQRLALDFGPRSRRLTVWLLDYPGGPEQFHPGAVLRVRGVVMRWRNPRGQTQNINVLTNSEADVQIRSAAPEPVIQSVAEAQLWNGPEEPAQAIWLDGVVTLVSPDQTWLVLQEGTAAMRVRLAEGMAAGAEPGDRLRVQGFPVLGDYTVALEDARVVARAPGEPVQAEPFRDAGEVLRNPGLVDRDARLIETGATLVDLRTRDDDLQVLGLSSAGISFAATLPLRQAVPAQVRPGSKLRLTGLCELQLTEERRRIAKPPDMFKLSLRDARDIRVLQAGPWWTPQRLRVATIMATGALVVLGAWIETLRRGNRRLRAEVAARERAERELANERRRVAAELHDTLEQTLTAASLQIHAASRTLSAQPETAARQLMLANQLVSRGRKEVRDAVWDLRLDERAVILLGPMLQRLCEELRGGEVRTAFLLRGEDAPCPSHIAVQVIRLVREAITNALKHGKPERVNVTLEASPGRWILTVKDDGKGFEPGAVPGPDTGHFGLVGMEERVQRLGGSLEMLSKPGQGCEVRVMIPREVA